MREKELVCWSSWGVGVCLRDTALGQGLSLQHEMCKLNGKLTSGLFLKDCFISPCSSQEQENTYLFGHVFWTTGYPSSQTGVSSRGGLVSRCPRSTFLFL